MKKLVVLSLVISFLLIGCGEDDKKEASQENFKRVLQEYYDKPEQCNRLTYQAFPVKEEERKDNINLTLYLELEKAGLVQSKVKEINRYGKTIKEYTFTLTEEGKKYYVNVKNDRGFKTEGICAAHYKVESIDNFTKPSNVMGITLSKVKYTIRPNKISPWLKELKKNKELVEATGMFSDKPRFFQNVDINKTFSKSYELVLTEMKGWTTDRP